MFIILVSVSHSYQSFGEFAAAVCGILHVEMANISKMLITVNSTTW